MFVNLQMKGYNKTEDVRFALSENEILIEVRDSKRRVHRLCKTLFREVEMA